jgi:FHA domain
MHIETDARSESAVGVDGTMSSLSAAERASLEEARSRLVAAEQLRCPHCQQMYLPGEVACPHCGNLFIDNGKTRNFYGILKELFASPKLPIGDAFAVVLRPIVFEIDGARLELPAASTLVVGRFSRGPDDLAPDVNLAAFNAEALGVSRRHVKIVRKHDLTYFSDMGSKNGTFLNARPVLGGSQRILRDKDELRLGHLKIRVRF